MYGETHVERNISVVNLAWTLLGLVLYLLVGLWMSRFWPMRTTFRFDLGWLLGAVCLSRLICVRRVRTRSSPTEYVTALLPLSTGLPLALGAHYALRGFMRGVSKPTLCAFAWFWCAYLVALIFWIVRFDYSEFMTFHGISRSQQSDRLMQISGLALALAFVVYACLFLSNLSDSPTLLLNQIVIVESRLLDAALAVYVFLALRLMYPRLEFFVLQSCGQSKEQ